MSEISHAIRAFAEEPDRHLSEIPLPTRRFRTPSYTLILSPSGILSAASAIRTSETDLDANIAEVRRLVREAGYTRTAWSIGPSSRPEGLLALLAKRGFVPATQPPFEPETTAMALVNPPRPAPAGVEARLVRSLDEYLQVWRIALEVFNESEEDAAGWLAAAPALWAQQDGAQRLAHLALLDGRPVGFGFSVAGADGLLLGGSGVLPAARGQGAYRALIAARWAEAVRLGKPALVIQAGPMARPILERSGFEPICHLDVLEDRSL